MPKFSQSSFSKLSTCHPDLQAIFFEVIKTFDCIVTEGYRNQADQEKAFNSGHSKVNWPNGKHNHQPSMAVDAYPYPIDWNNERLALWFGGYVLGIAQMLKAQGKITHSIRWGGSWNGLGKLNTGKMLNDTGHFEIIE